MDPTLFISIFVMTACLVGLLGVVVSGTRGQLAKRMSGIASLDHTGSETTFEETNLENLAVRVIPKLAVPLIPREEEEQGKLKVRLVQAGWYGENAMSLFLGIKMTSMLLPLILGALAGLSGLVSMQMAVVLGALGGAIGLVAPNIWLSNRIAWRQAEIRRSLPDGIDMIVVCVDGGMSLPAAIMRVGKELQLAHPLLSHELRIVNRSAELGQTLPEALRQFAARIGLEELRFLASIVAESERFGTSVADSLRIHADTLRVERQHRAEESARKASVKLLFPTVFLIFPVLFLVVLFPPLIKILNTLR